MAAKKPRADAERNRQLLLKTAKKVLAEKGKLASLEEIARAAGVGIGTLYRHFPTRDALVEEVYRNETNQLTSAATRLAESKEPVEALREWMAVFVEYIATKSDMSEALNSVTGGPAALYASTYDRMKEAMRLLVDRAVAAGDIRELHDPLDLLRALSGVAHAGGTPNWKKGALELIDILIAGIRTTPPKHR